jgi:hypothetical protein
VTDANTIAKPAPAARTGPASTGRPEFSVVIPVHNEAENVEALATEIADRLSGRAYEMIFVDDSSLDDTRARLAALRAKIPSLRVLGHRTNAGQSRAVRSGVTAAQAPVIVTLDGDGQNDPDDIIGLVSQLTRADAPANLALVQGHREKRQDSGWKRFGSRWANAVRRSMLKDDIADSGHSLFRPHAPLSSGADDLRRVRGRIAQGQSSRPALRQVELHQFRPPRGRPVRPARRDVAAPAASVARRGGRNLGQARLPCSGRRARHTFVIPG